MSLTLQHIAVVLAGGALGGIGRFWLSGLVARRCGEQFPWGTLAVNASGALAIGLLAGFLAAPGGTPQDIPGEGPAVLWLVLVVGILGSYTTVSSFSLQTLTLLREGAALRAFLNVAASLLLCLGAAALGLWAADAWVVDAWAGVR